MYALQLTQSYCPAQADEELHDTTVGGVLRAAAAKWPNAPALQEVDAEGNLGRQWTYAELLADSERLALALLTRHRPGERIAVWAPNIPEWVIAEFALGLAGLVLVTVNPGYQPRELKYVLEQSRAAGLFLINEFRGNPMAKIAAEVVADIPAIREVIDMEDHAALFREAVPTGALPQVDPRDPVQIQYTSGTTGFPKGVVLHHHGITNNARHFFARMGGMERETVLSIMPLFHTAGCGICILGAVQYGHRIILPRIFDPAGAIAIIEREGVNFALGVPTNKDFLAAVLRDKRFANGDATTDFLSHFSIEGALFGEWGGWSNNPAHRSRGSERFFERNASQDPRRLRGASDGRLEKPRARVASASAMLWASAGVRLIGLG